MNFQWKIDPECHKGISERCTLFVAGGALRMYAQPSVAGGFCAHVVLGKDAEHGDDWYVRELVKTVSIAEAKTIAQSIALAALRRIIANGKAAEQLLAGLDNAP